MKVLLFIIAAFIGSSQIALADDVEHIPLVEFESEAPAFLDNDCRHRHFAQYSRNNFRNIGAVRNWCQGFLSEFGLDFGRLDEFCGWERRGSYGNYWWNARFVYQIFQYRGNPRFFSERCSQ